MATAHTQLDDIRCSINMASLLYMIVNTPTFRLNRVTIGESPKGGEMRRGVYAAVALSKGQIVTTYPVDVLIGSRLKNESLPVTYLYSNRCTKNYQQQVEATHSAFVEYAVAYNDDFMVAGDPNIVDVDKAGHLMNDPIGPVCAPRNSTELQERQMEDAQPKLYRR